MKRKLILTILIVLAATSFCFADKTINTNEPANAVYLVFKDKPGNFTVNGVPCENDYFLQQYIEIEPALEIKIEGATPIECAAFDKANAPANVHKWEEPCEKADLLLISSHADDEQLFFAGILPYYSQVRKYEVQVAYATDHYAEPVRHQERLNGLWECGIRHYPVSAGYYDLYSESYDEALRNLASYDVTEEKIIAWEKSLLKQFEPKVLITHDVNGEYGHGMHILVNGTVQKALANAKSEFPFLQRVYFHLYDEGQVKLTWEDEAFDELGGFTPFQVTQQKGFECHKSQHWTWFKRWIHGRNNEITKAEQITTYSPMDFGCYYKADSFEPVQKDDFFEGLMSYAEEAEAKRIAEEEAAKAAAEAEAEALRIAQEEAAKKNKLRKITFIGLSLVGVVIIIIAIALRRRK